MRARMKQLPSRIGGISPRGIVLVSVVWYAELRNTSAFHRSCGPVIEQGTHFCDLSRYFGGDVDISTVNAHSLEWYENAGVLTKQTIDETRIAPENRIPRVTSATWKYENGAVGSFTHVVALQGRNYSCELEIYADGYQFKYAPLSSTPSLSHRLIPALIGSSTPTCSPCSIFGALART
jgi:predicted dehydrogenase